MIDFNLFSHNNVFNQVISFHSILPTQVVLCVYGCSVYTNKALVSLQQGVGSSSLAGPLRLYKNEFRVYILKELRAAP